MGVDGDGVGVEVSLEVQGFGGGEELAEDCLSR